MLKWSLRFDSDMIRYKYNNIEGWRGMSTFNVQYAYILIYTALQTKKQ